MCVIIHIPAGVELPAKQTLLAASRTNHDGIGIVTSSGRSIKTMSFEKAYKFMKNSSLGEDLLIHMRYATHGSVKTANCHPFYDEDTHTWFAHNGVLPIASKNDMTDSEICFRERIVPAIKQYGYMGEQMVNVVERERGYSRFAFLHDGKVTRFGDFQKVDGVYYSNTHFMPLRQPLYRWSAFLAEGESDIEL